MKGGFANRMAVIILIQSAPPPRPQCYPTEKTWIDWLIQAHLSGLRVTRRVDTGKTQGHRVTSTRLLHTSAIPYCSGCTRGYQAAMQAQGRCNPSPALDGKEPTTD